MINLFNFWYQRGWHLIDETEYQKAYENWGGSLITHPVFIRKLSNHLSISLQYFGFYQNQRLVAAIPAWGRFIAGQKNALKKYNCYHKVDIGNMEVILPISPEAKNIPMYFSCQFISLLSHAHIRTASNQSETLSLLKNKNEFSRKFIYNRKRELRLLQNDGISIAIVSQFTPKQIAFFYIQLFKKRWNKNPRALTYIEEQLIAMREFMAGYLLIKNNQAIAIQILFFSKSVNYLSVEFINAGIDPAFSHFSPGSTLTYLNTEWAAQHAKENNLELRYSFGKTDEEYKTIWCKPTPVYFT